MNLYGLYKNNKLILVGTSEEIAEHENISIKSVHYYTTPTYRKRRKYNGRSKTIVKMNKEKLELDIKLNKIEKLYNMGFRFNEALNIVG